MKQTEESYYESLSKINLMIDEIRFVLSPLMKRQSESNLNDFKTNDVENG